MRKSIVFGLVFIVLFSLVYASSTYNVNIVDYLKYSYNVDVSKINATCMCDCAGWYISGSVVNLNTSDSRHGYLFAGCRFYPLTVVVEKHLYDGVDGTVDVILVFDNIEFGERIEVDVNGNSYSGEIGYGKYRIYPRTWRGNAGDNLVFEVEKIEVFVGGEKKDVNGFWANGDVVVKVVVGIFKSYTGRTWTGDVLGDWILFAVSVFPLVLGLVLYMFFGKMGFLSSLVLLVYFARTHILPPWIGVVVGVLLTLVIFWREKVSGGVGESE